MYRAAPISGVRVIGGVIDGSVGVRTDPAHPTPAWTPAPTSDGQTGHRSTIATIGVDGGHSG